MQRLGVATVGLQVLLRVNFISVRNILVFFYRLHVATFEFGCWYKGLELCLCFVHELGNVLAICSTFGSCFDVLYFNCLKDSGQKMAIIAC